MVNLFLTDEVTWIPVNEELPEYENIPVLIWVENETVDNKPGGYFGYYSHKTYDNRRGRWFDIYGESINGVTHWACFPKGPDCKLLVAQEIHDRFYDYSF